MVTLNDALMELVTKKLVAPEEAYAKAVDKAGLESPLKRFGFDPQKAASAAPPAASPGASQRPAQPGTLVPARS